jgi:hypothetical protein
MVPNTITDVHGVTTAPADVDRFIENRSTGHSRDVHRPGHEVDRSRQRIAVDTHGDIGDSVVQTPPFPMEMGESFKSIITEQGSAGICSDPFGEHSRRTVEIHNGGVGQLEGFAIDLRNHHPSAGGQDDRFTFGQDLQQSASFADAKTFFGLFCKDLSNTPSGATFDDSVEVYEPETGTYGESATDRRLP